MPGSLLRLFLAFGLVLGMTAVSPRASAQLGGPAIVLPQRITRQVELRSQKANPYWVSYSDCLADDTLTFAVTFTGGFSGQRLEVWAGTTDCSQVASRTGQSPQCWQVYAGTVATTPSDVNIRARDIAGKHKRTETPNGPGSGKAEDCDKGTENALPLVLYFMFVSNDTAIGPVAQWKSTGLDITRPAPPTNVKASTGETRIHLSWTVPADPDVVEYRFYCDPPASGSSGTGGTTSTDGGPLSPLVDDTATVYQHLDAGFGTGGDLGSGGYGTGGDYLGLGGFYYGTGGAGGTGGTDTGSSTGGEPAAPQENCIGNSPITDGSVPPKVYQCGSVTGRATHNGIAEGLTNGVQYAVAVAAVDLVGNVGKLSVNQCATPEEITDFFEYYRLNGGTGGGGFCSLSPQHRSGAAFVSAGLLALALSALRRRGRRS